MSMKNNDPKCQKCGFSLSYHEQNSGNTKTCMQCQQAEGNEVATLALELRRFWQAPAVFHLHGRV